MMVLWVRSISSTPQCIKDRYNSPNFIDEKTKKVFAEQFDLYRNVEDIKYKYKYYSYSDAQEVENRIHERTMKYNHLLLKNEIIDKNYIEMFRQKYSQF